MVLLGAACGEALETRQPHVPQEFTCAGLRPQCLLYCTQPPWCPLVTSTIPRNEVCGGFHICFVFHMLSVITNKDISEKLSHYVTL